MDIISNFRGSYAFLSNFYLAKVIYNGHTYRTSEHAFAAAKATNEKDRQYVANATTPGIAKRRGREIKCRPDWNVVKATIMAEIVYHKFAQNPELYAMLRATGSAALVEGNWWNDTYWGVCKGIGENMLGKILMIVRNL